MTIDDAIALAYKRVPVLKTSDRPFCEVRLQIDLNSTNATLSRDTFLQEPHVSDFYGTGATPVDAILSAIADFENCIGLHASCCALHNAPAQLPGPCDCGAYPEHPFL